MTQSSSPFRLLADIWKDGVDAFLSDLKEQGFDPTPNKLFSTDAKSLWNVPLRARAYSAEHRVGDLDPEKSFTYIGRDASVRSLQNNSDNFALVVADKSFEKNESRAFK